MTRRLSPPPTSSWTPLNAARGYARQHPGERGVLDVISWQPKGRNGWKGLGRKRTRFYFAAGQVQFRKVLKPQVNPIDRWGEWLHNGPCHVCGVVHLAPVLRWCEDQDGLFALACPECIVSNALVFLRGYLDERKRSPLARFADLAAVTLDIRQCQLKHDEAPVIRVPEQAAAALAGGD